MSETTIPVGFTIRVLDDNDGQSLDRGVWFGFANGYHVSIQIGDGARADEYPFTERRPIGCVSSPNAEIAVLYGGRIVAGPAGFHTPEQVLGVLNCVAGLRGGELPTDLLPDAD
jgi:hypothetical protein